MAAAVGTRLERYREIASVLSRHGLSFIIGATGLDRFEPAAQEQTRASNPENLRRALEELGPTFVKLGQVLSTRSDVLPPAYLTELAKLQDRAPVVPAAVIKRLIVEELGDQPDKVFASFQLKPLASASIGQAHLATLHDGTEVVVKVQRPDIATNIAIDLEILHTLAVRASRQWKLAADYNITGITDEFARTLREELDYTHEGRNAETFAANFAGDDTIQIPRVFWDTSTTRVLTLERITGIKVDDLVALDAAGIDRRGIVVHAVDAIAQMVFVDGVFHADPHPGNLFVEASGRIGLIDFGMVGQIDDTLRGQLADLFMALSRHDPDRMASALMALSSSKSSIDQESLRADLVGFIDIYRGKGLGEVDTAALINKLLAVLRHNRLQLQPSIVMLLRMLLMVEGMGVLLDPTFNLGDALKPYATKLALSKFSPAAIARRLAAAGLEAAELGIELPDKIRKVFDVIDRNGIEVHLRASELDPLVARVERVGNRVVAGVIAAAFIRGIGELAVSDRKRFGHWSGPLMGIGLGASGALSAYIALTSMRRRRQN
ncbi:ABC transporter [Agreia bicolorata]|uniref:ABC transporter n=1 Tax=Agreia bicolorata TaxID=110935 RepID=A0ABR5CHW0_9MICO|nr:ABC transporter [Agreia bicolorata]